MADLKNHIFHINHASGTLVMLLISIIVLFLISFFSSSSLSDFSPSVIISSFTSRLLTAANFFSSSSTSSNTCTLSSIALGRIRGKNDSRIGREIDLVSKELSSCDIFDGRWVSDDSGPIYNPGSCPYVEDKFNCYKNGRPDSGFLHYRWQPHGCTIPRFDGRKMLEILRGKRVVFVGDSLNRNMWESLVCSLRQSLKDKNRGFEVSGRRNFRTSNGLYAFRFKDFRCSIDFVKSPFLVQESKFSDATGYKRETLRLDVIQETTSKLYRDADIIIFNTGHWWTHQKTFKGKGYFQEGRRVYERLGVTEAYTRALHTWANWVDANINSSQTRVFFVGYSSSHFRRGTWNTGGRCDDEIKPTKNKTYAAGGYPWMMKVLESVISEMNTPVFYMNITKMTWFRTDGHPSIYRQPPEKEIRRSSGMFQDCSHWCLPGVPDSWNQLLYATLLVSHRSLSEKLIN